jgi:hypothetical protein
LVNAIYRAEEHSIKTREPGFRYNKKKKEEERIAMTIASVLKKVPWKKVVRVIPGALGIAGEYAVRNVEKKKVDALQRIEEQQSGLERSVSMIAHRVKILMWVAAATLVISLAALIIALVR